MADVPAWVLVLNTVAAGGFGLAGTYLVPRAQREARLAEERRENAAVMRAKAEEIFRAIAAIDDAAHQAVIQAVASAIGAEEELAPMVKFDTIRALAAVYYPNLLPIMDKFEAPAEKRLERMAPFNAAVQAGDKEALAKATGAMAAERVEDGQKLFLVASRMTRELRMQLIKDVKPYLPM